LPDTIRVIKWQEGEMGGAHYVHGRKHAYRVLDENWKEVDHPEDLAIDGRLI
jgi:hypothetical protein